MILLDKEVLVSERIAQLILCLPLYDSLVSDGIRRICDHVKED